MSPPTAQPDPLHLRLAGVTRLSVQGRGPKDAFLFDPHRLALPCWALALADGPPALLVTLDRHFDLVPPPATTPRGLSLEALDTYARWSLDVRNVDHVLAAMEAGLLTDALVVARSRPKGALEAEQWTDRHGQPHRLWRATSLAHVAEGFGTGSASPEGRWLEQALANGARVLLDVDLDCFTTPNDVDPTELLPWPLEQIRGFLRPEGAEPFWRAVLPRTVAVTVAREPYHCGGVVAAGRLFEAFAQAFFVELLGADLP